MWNTIELNNGEKIPTEKIEETLLDLLDEAVKNVGHELSYDEAIIYPRLPKMISVYSVYFGSLKKAYAAVGQLHYQRKEEKRREGKGLVHVGKLSNKEIARRNLERTRAAVREGRARAEELERERRSRMSVEEMEEKVLSLYVRKGKMPGPKILKRDRELFYADLLDAFGGSYRRMKKYFDELYQRRFSSNESEECVLEDDDMMDGSMMNNDIMNDSIEVKDKIQKEEVGQEGIKEKKKMRNRAHSVTKDDVIESLREYWRRVGELPTNSKLRELREQEADVFFGLSTYYRYLGGNKKSWRAYLDNEITQEHDVESSGSIEREMIERSMQEVIEDKEVVDKIVCEAVDEVGATGKGRNLWLSLKIKTPGMSEPYEIEVSLRSQ